MTLTYGRLRRLTSGPARVVSILGFSSIGATFHLGCTSSSGPGAKSAADARQHRDTALVHEECDIKSGSVQKLSASGTAPEIYIVQSGGRESCRAVDFNRDGRIETWVYVDGSGQVRRRESDFDRDGRIDDIMIYKGGSLIERDQATTLRGKLDTWQFYQGGKLVRAERDSDGDAVIDQWWEYPKTADCPMIHSDVDGDGRPDPGSTVDYCKETGYVPPERPGERKVESPNFSKPGDMPTELDSKPAGGEGEKPAEPPKKDK